jgi:hypothetical protein
VDDFSLTNVKLRTRALFDAFHRDHGHDDAPVLV